MSSSSPRLKQLLKLNITGNTLLKDIVPAGHRIRSIRVATMGDGAGMVLNIGTTADGAEVVEGYPLQNARPGAKLKQLAFPASQSLYVNAGGGQPWSDISIDLFVVLEQVIHGPVA